MKGRSEARPGPARWAWLRASAWVLHWAIALGATTASLVGSPAAASAWPDPPSPPVAAPNTPAPELLAALIRHSRLAMPLKDGRLSGPGGELWRTLAAASAHVVFGEQHGNQGIARIAHAMWADLANAGWRHAALEIDPFVASAMQGALRQGGPASWSRFLAARGGSAAVPFVGWDEEVALAADVRHIWGLDQVYIGSAAWLLRDLLAAADNGLDAAGRSEVQRFIDEAAAQPQWLGRVDPERLRRAAAAAAPASPARRLLAALHESAPIYAPFSGGAGEPTLANERREQAMKRGFAEQFRRAEAEDGRAPRVFVKVGGYHGMRGATPTGVQGLGGFVTEFAAARGQAVLSVIVLCGPGSQGAVHAAPAQACDGWLHEGDWQFLRPYVDAREPTLFDLRTWRLRPRRLQALPAEVQRMVGAYDLLVFVPAAPAASALVSPGGR